MLRRTLLALPLAINAASCDLVLGSYDVWYRLHILIEKGNAQYSGSSVLHTKWTGNGPLTGFDDIGAFSKRTWGDAITINTGEFGLIFGLLLPATPQGGHGFNAQSPERIFGRHRVVDRTRLGDPHSILKSISDVRGSFPVPHVHWPTLIRFRDLRDKTSAERVADDIQNGYPPYDIRIREVRFETTTAFVTRGIERHFPWWHRVQGPYSPTLTGDPTSISQNFDPNVLSSQLTRHNFKMDGYRS